MSGRALGVMDSQGACKYVNMIYDANTVTQAQCVISFPCRVVSIVGRPRVAGSGGACTFTFYKCASAIAAASGTLLHSGSYDVAGTADTNQTLTMVANADARSCVAGDSINAVLSGTPTSAVGVITITLDPL